MSILLSLLLATASDATVTAPQALPNTPSPQAAAAQPVVAAQPAIAAQGKAKAKLVANDDRVICKRFTQIGSLVGTRKECQTKHEWDRQFINNRREAQEFVKRNSDGLISN